MTSASTFLAAAWAFLRASKTSGLWRIRRDLDLARLGAAFADLDARHRQRRRLPGSTGEARMSAFTAALMAGLATYRGHRADAAASVEACLAQLDRGVAYAEGLIDEGHVRLVALEPPSTPSDPAATRRYGWQAVVIGLALLAAPAFAQDALPTPPVMTAPPVPAVPPPRWVAPVEPQDDNAKVCGPAAHAALTLEQLAGVSYLAEIAATQQQILRTLRQIAADQARGAGVDLQTLSALGQIESDLSTRRLDAGKRAAAR